MDLDYVVSVGADALAELTTKVYGTGDDKITVREVVRLNGERARGLTKTRVAVRDEAVSQVYTHRRRQRARRARAHELHRDRARRPRREHAARIVRATRPR